MRAIHITPMGTREKVGDKISERVIESLVDTFGSSTINAIGRIRKKRNRK